MFYRLLNYSEVPLGYLGYHHLCFSYYNGYSLDGFRRLPYYKLLNYSEAPLGNVHKLQMFTRRSLPCSTVLYLHV
jgi:hypothetical protein